MLFLYLHILSMMNWLYHKSLQWITANYFSEIPQITSVDCHKLLQ